ncbi:PIN domain-containing protein [Planotetraspora sp. A-T 1434]|uniref:PIN domain-containing protein n=1 Tax=Planotetraspora sp. A-T 1434 TaxID=2979219 RepID=UPI0021C17A26|nr:PIN domain-containing protein [Planotetraspora sp. A-T 1434]MCT9932320.1 PIN domain-containing protein [Planotetraspora sp. A-T 1434]
MTRGFVLDTGALIALEKPAKNRIMIGLLADPRPEHRLVISAGSVAEAWRGDARQAALAMLLRRSDVQVAEITVPVAKAIGAYLGQRADGDDLVDAHVVMLARHHRLPVITADPDDLRAFDPKLFLVEI